VRAVTATLHPSDENSCRPGLAVLGVGIGFGCDALIRFRCGHGSIGADHARGDRARAGLLSSQSASPSTRLALPNFTQVERPQTSASTSSWTTVSVSVLGEVSRTCLVRRGWRITAAWYRPTRTRFWSTSASTR